MSARRSASTPTWKRSGAERVAGPGAHDPLLRFFGDLSQTWIARQVGLSQMHVSRLLTQTLATLRGCLEAD
jgi:Sigma-70, region 4